MSEIEPKVRNPQAQARRSGRYDIAEIAASFPDSAATMIMDQYLADKPSASCRVFRTYRPVPPHYHETCDEYLYVVSGRGTFWMEHEANKAEFGPGQLLYFERRTVHALPDIIEEPVVFLSVDAPRRDPRDVIFVNPEDGTPETFVSQNRPRGY